MVDDDVGLNSLYAESFATEFPEYSICTAADGAEAAELVSQMQYDLVITDLNMPVLDGCKLYRLTSDIAEQASRKPPPFIFCSGVKDALDRARQACPESQNRFILKPFSLAKLQKLIVETLEGTDRVATPPPSR